MKEEDALAFNMVESYINKAIMYHFHYISHQEVLK